MVYDRLDALAWHLRQAGLDVVEVDGWRGNGRPGYTGSFDPEGILCHHTGAYDGMWDAADDLGYAKWLANVGRSDLPAPLCHLALSAEGVYYVCANGRANHAGVAKASGPMPYGDGNELYLGIEAMNSGTQGFGRKQRRAYVKGCAVLCVAYGWPASHVRGHKETSTTGKWDPGKLGMNRFRRQVRREMKRVSKPGPRINMDHLQAAWNRPGGRTYNPWGVRACRRWRKALGKQFMPGTKYKWLQGWFGKYLRHGTRRANKFYDIEKWTGKDNTRPTWALALELGARPYRTKKNRGRRLEGED